MKTPNSNPDGESYASAQQINDIVSRYTPQFRLSQIPPVLFETENDANPNERYFLECNNRSLSSLTEFKDYEDCLLTFDIYETGLSLSFVFIAHPLPKDLRHVIRREITLLGDGSGTDFTNYTDTIATEQAIEQQALLTTEQKQALEETETAKDDLVALIDDLEGMPEMPTDITLVVLKQLDALLQKIIPIFPD